METPHASAFADPSAERRFLAAMLFHAEEWFGSYVDCLSPEHFSELVHRQLFELLANRWNACLQVNPKELKKELCHPEMSASPELLALINQLTSKTVDYAEMELLFHRLTEKRILREINRITCQLNELVGKSDQDAVRNQLIDRLHRLIPELASHRYSNPESIKVHVLETIEQIEQRYTSNDSAFKKHVKFPTGIPSVDVILDGGLNPGDLMVIAGEPATGKTALAISCALRVAVDCKRSASYFSLDLTEVEIVRRFIASGANHNYLHLLQGKISEPEFPAIIEQANKIADSQVCLVQTPGITLVELWGLVQKNKERFDTCVVIIDPIHLMDRGKVTAIADRLGRLKELAVELEVAVVALCDIPKETITSSASEKILFEDPVFSEFFGRCDLLTFLTRPHPVKSGVERLHLSVWQRAMGFVGQAALNFNPTTGRIAALNLPIHPPIPPKK